MELLAVLLVLMLCKYLIFTPPQDCGQLSTSNKSCDLTTWKFSKEWTFGLKGILATLIIIHHISTHLTEWYGESFYWQRAVVGRFVPFGEIVVGIFFFVSGYGMMVSYKAKGKEYIDTFLRKRFLKLLPPFLVLGLLNQLLISLRTSDWNILQRFIDFALHGKFFFLWFVTMLIWFYLAFYVSFKNIKNETMAAHSVFLIVLALSLYVGLRGYGDWWWKSNLCLPIGIYYANYEKKITSWLKKDTRWKITLFTAFLVALCIISRTSLSVVTVKIVTLTLPVLLVGYTYQWRFPNNRVFSFLSDISYEMFLVHVMLLNYIPLLGLPPIGAALALLALTIPFAWLAHKCFALIKI